LRMEHYDVVAAENPQAALQHADESIDVVVSDLRMGRSSGLDLLRYWVSQYPEVPFIMVTAYGDVESAVTAMKLGARDYLTKPVNPEELLELIHNCLEVRNSRRAAHDFRAELPALKGLDKIIGRSAEIRHVCDQTRRAAQSDSTVLILGESGTGKELIAEALHENSPRQLGPFVVANMAAIPDTLVESELFGHVKGSFTGATADRLGRFELANNGTLFIDEIGDFPAASQAKLLRVLENRTVTRVGANEPRTVNVRVVAATSRNLEQMVARSEFREDLYYRLNVVCIHLPPLRERRDDIALLAQHFLADVCQANRIVELTLDPPLVERLEHFDWPGNVRQLRNSIESMVVLAKGPVLTVGDLPRNIAEPTGSVPAMMPAVGPNERTLEEMQRNAILQALRRFDGNRTRAAESLGISVRTLQRRLKDWETRGDLSEPT